MLNKQIIIMLILVGLSIPPLYASDLTSVSKNGQQAQKQATFKTVMLSVPGMTCAVCPITVKKALEKVDGVSKVVVDFKTKTATVTFDPEETTISNLTNATKQVGYPSSKK